MSQGTTTYDVTVYDIYGGGGNFYSNMSFEELKALQATGLDYTITATHNQTMLTIIEATSIQDFQNKAPSSPIIPAGNDLDLQITVSAWMLVQTGMTLPQLAGNYGWADQLSQAGLRINSVDQGVFSTTIIYHCTAVQDVNISAMVLDNNYKITEAGAGAKILTYAILGVLLALGLTAGITYIKVSSDVVAATQAKANLTAQLANQGYTADQIATILGKVNTTATDITPSGSNLPGWVLPVAIAGIVALTIGPNLFGNRSK